MRFRALIVLVLSAGHAAGCMHTSSTPHTAQEPRPSSEGQEPRVVTAEALLSAWFGCAMGETWMAALETPPHTWAEPGLARCHAVGRVVDAPAARLRAFVPDAVAAVSRGLDGKLGPGWGYSGDERQYALELFRLGTLALEESTFSFDAAKAIAKESSEGSEALDPQKASLLRPRFFRMSRAERLSSLWEFGNDRAGVRSAQATALAWMLVLERVTRARELPPDLRAAHIAFALEAVARVPPPSAWTGHTTTSEDWDAYLSRATRTMTGVPIQVSSSREVHAAMIQAIAQRLRSAAHPLPTSELRRAALGCAEAFLRDTSSAAHDTM